MKPTSEEYEPLQFDESKLQLINKPHSSFLRNKGIGAVFYDIELIEQW